jgi:hypothetical protein
LYHARRGASGAAAHEFRFIFRPIEFRAHSPASPEASAAPPASILFAAMRVASGRVAQGGVGARMGTA